MLATRGAILHNLLQVHSLREGTDDMENKREVESLFKALKDTLLTQTVYAREAANYQVGLICNWGEGRGFIMYLPLHVI